MDILPLPHYLSNEQLDEIISSLIDNTPRDVRSILSYIKEKQYRMLNEISMTYETNPIEEDKQEEEKKDRESRIVKGKIVTRILPRSLGRKK